MLTRWVLGVVSVVDDLRVGVIGGSIGGCTAAAELIRAGCEVTVLERSVGSLEGRGAGIGTPMATFDRLIERDLIDASTPRTVLTRHALVGRDPAGGRVGRAPLVLPMEMATLHWRDLWGQLRARVPDDAYVEATAVERIVEIGSDMPGVELTDGTQLRFDMLVCADGYASAARGQLFPSSRLGYRGYVLWRGLLPETDVDDTGPLEDTLFRFSFDDLGGNGVFYFVPGEDGSVVPGERLVNWAHYVPVPEGELDTFLTDNDGIVHEHSLPPGGMPPDQEAQLRELMRDHLPPYFAELTAQTSNTFAQPIFTYTPDSFRVGRCCMIGDAAAVVAPFTGSGVFKSSNNAIDLAQAIADSPDASQLDNVLEVWSATETAGARRLAALGAQMEQAFVWAAPDLGSMTEDEAKAWWADSITFPDDFTYIADHG